MKQNKRKIAYQFGSTKHFDLFQLKSTAFIQTSYHSESVFERVVFKVYVRKLVDFHATRFQLH